MTHATDEQDRWKEVRDADEMRAWGAYRTLAHFLAGDAVKAEKVADLLCRVARREVRPDEQHDDFVELIFG